MSEEVYLSNLDWTKTHDNIGCVMGNVVLKNSKSYEEYEKLLDTTYYILTKKDEIERLNKRIKELEEGFKATIEDLCEESTKIEKAIEYIEKLQSFQHTNGSTHEELRNLKSILKGEDKE